MSFFVLLAYIFIYYIRPAEWIPWLRINWQLYFGIISILIIIGRYFKDTKCFYEDRYGLLVISFFLTALLSKALTGWFGGVIVIFETFLPAVIIYFMIQSACTNDNNLKSAFLFITCLVTIIAVHAILQYNTGKGFGEIAAMKRVIGYNNLQEEITIQQVTWYGVFNDPNDLGMIFVLCVPFVLQQLLSKKVFYIFPLAMCIIGIFLTNSRGTFVSLIVAIIAYFLLKTKSIKGFAIASLLCSVLIVFGPSRISQINTTETSSIGRLEAWVAAFQMFKQAPFFGIGPENFTDHYFITAHNSYMLALAETGFVGLVCFLGITVVPLIEGVKMVLFSSRTTPEEHILTSVLAGFIGVCFSMFFISRTYMMIPYMMSGFVVASMKAYDPECYMISFAKINLRLLLKTAVIFILVMYCIAKLT